METLKSERGAFGAQQIVGAGIQVITFPRRRRF